MLNPHIPPMTCVVTGISDQPMLTTHRAIGTIGYMGGIMAVPEEFTWSWGNLLLFAQEALCANPGEHIHPVRTKFS